MAGHHGEQLLVAVGAILLVVGLVVLLDHEVACVPGHAVDTERLDVEMATDEMERAVIDVGVPRVDLGQGLHVGQGGPSHTVPCGDRSWRQYCQAVAGAVSPRPWNT